MWRLVAGLAIALAAVAGGGAAATVSAPALPGLPTLPPQLLVAESTHGVRLLGLDGHVYARLGSLRLENPVYDARLGPVVGTGKRTFQLDLVSKALLPVGSLGHSLTLRFSDRDAWLERDGARVADLGRYGSAWLTPDRSLLTIGSYRPGGWRKLMDLDSDKTFALPSGCVVYSRRGSTWRAFCTSSESRSGRYELRLLRSIGAGWKTEGRWRRSEASWQEALLSPDGQSVLVQAALPCEEGAVELVVGGVRRRLTDDGFALGWTRAGKALVYLDQGAEGSCGTAGRDRAGVYAIGPTSGIRHWILGATAALWPPAPSEAPPPAG
ncbi:MAG: hypothetical protein ACXVY3_04260 [Gaiellaceae bacterium]